MPRTSDKLAMHGVFSGVSCSEREHPTQRRAGRSTPQVIVHPDFSVSLVFLTVQRWCSRRDMRTDCDMLHITGCLESRKSLAKKSFTAENHLSSSAVGRLLNGSSAEGRKSGRLGGTVEK